MLNWIVSLYSEWRSKYSTPSVPTTATATVSENRADGPAAEDRDDGSTVESADAPTDWRDLLDGEEVSRQEVQIELGLQPQEFLVWLVRDAGGHMWQTEMVDTTGWSKSTVSRYLDSLESDGTVQRVWVGRRKLVGIPDELPDCVPAAERSPVEPPTSPVSSWSLEADEPA